MDMAEFLRPKYSALFPMIYAAVGSFTPNGRAFQKGIYYS
jgi:hypothetical protein